MPTAILLAGPNGAGKTTFASAILRVAGRDIAFLTPTRSLAASSPP